MQTSGMSSENGQIVSPFNPVIVIGMHRSGTSLLASIIEAAGVKIGEHMVPASQFNSPGYFEDLDFVNLNKALLRASGVHESGHEKPISPVSRLEPNSQANLESLIVRKAAGGGCWGMKDPRITLLLEPYLAVLPRALCVISLRPFDAVIDSMVRRSLTCLPGKPSRFGAALHQRYLQMRLTNSYAEITALYYREMYSRLPPDRTFVVLTNSLEASVIKLDFWFREHGAHLRQVSVAGLRKEGLMKDPTDRLPIRPALRRELNSLERRILSRFSN